MIVHITIIAMNEMKCLNAKEPSISFVAKLSRV